MVRRQLNDYKSNKQIGNCNFVIGKRSKKLASYKVHVAKSITFGKWERLNFVISKDKD